MRATHVNGAQCQLSVVIPTRNERDNVAHLLERLHRSLAGNPVEVIFVDDSSDDTPQVVEGLASEYDSSSTRVLLIHRRPEDRGDGLAGAVVSGLRHAGSEYVAVMDSDLQHPPEVLIDLLSAARAHEAELVVGSRYVGDGDADGLSSTFRRVTSRGAGSAAHALFPRRLKSITDPMSGLFLVRRDVLDPDSFHPIGFKILLEIAVRRGPLKVVEVPYVFGARHAGESKAGLEEGLRFLRHLVRLRLGNLWGRMVSVGAIGVSGVAVNTFALWFFISVLGLGLTLGALLATQVSTLWNALLALGLVYRDRRGRDWWSSMLKIALVNNAALLMRIPLLHLLVQALGLGYLWANLLTLVLAFGLRFSIIDRSLTRSENAMTVTRNQTGTDVESRMEAQRKPAWLDYHYAIPGLVRIGSQIRLPELEFFRVPASPEALGIEIRMGQVGKVRIRTRLTTGGGVTVYEEHLGSKGSSFKVEMGSPMHVTVAPMLAKSPHVVYTNIVEALLRFTAVAQNKILLHSACLEIGGVGVILSAKTDTGKTGTILRLLRERNARFLSDDMTIVSPDGTCQAFPKPLTISQHTLRAVEADDLTAKEWRRLRLQSRLHSKEGRGIGLWLARSNLPIMGMNAVVQRLIPPPKYTAGRLVPCWTVESVRLSDAFIIQRGDALTEAIDLETAVEEFLDNTDDAYGFPPFATFAPTLEIDGMGWAELRSRERDILRRALGTAARIRRLGSDSFDWADRIPGLITHSQPCEQRQAAIPLQPGKPGAVAPVG